MKRLWVCLVLSVGCGTTIPDEEYAVEDVLPLEAVQSETAGPVSETKWPVSETAGPVGETAGPVGETQTELQETPSAEVVVPEAEPRPAEIAKPEQRYWITTKTRIRHNAGCRYYKTSKGAPCGPNDGRECKICGG